MENKQEPNKLMVPLLYILYELFQEPCTLVPTYAPGLLPLSVKIREGKTLLPKFLKAGTRSRDTFMTMT